MTISLQRDDSASDSADWSTLRIHHNPALRNPALLSLTLSSAVASVSESDSFDVFFARLLRLRILERLDDLHRLLQPSAPAGFFVDATDAATDDDGSCPLLFGVGAPAEGPCVVRIDLFITTTGLYSCRLTKPLDYDRLVFSSPESFGVSDVQRRHQVLRHGVDRVERHIAAVSTALCDLEQHLAELCPIHRELMAVAANDQLRCTTQAPSHLEAERSGPTWTRRLLDIGAWIDGFWTRTQTINRILRHDLHSSDAVLAQAIYDGVSAEFGAVGARLPAT